MTDANRGFDVITLRGLDKYNRELQRVGRDAKQTEITFNIISFGEYTQCYKLQVPSKKAIWNYCTSPDANRHVWRSYDRSGDHTVSRGPKGATLLYDAEVA